MIEIWVFPLLAFDTCTTFKNDVFSHRCEYCPVNSVYLSKWFEQVSSPSDTVIIPWQLGLPFGSDFLNGETLTIPEDTSVYLAWAAGHNVYRAAGSCDAYPTLDDYRSAESYESVYTSRPSGQDLVPLPYPEGRSCYACISHYTDMQFTLQVLPTLSPPYNITCAEAKELWREQCTSTCTTPNENILFTRLFQIPLFYTNLELFNGTVYMPLTYNVSVERFLGNFSSVTKGSYPLPSGAVFIYEIVNIYHFFQDSNRTLKAQFINNIPSFSNSFGGATVVEEYVCGVGAETDLNAILCVADASAGYSSPQDTFFQSVGAIPDLKKYVSHFIYTGGDSMIWKGGMDIVRGATDIFPPNATVCPPPPFGCLTYYHAGDRAYFQNETIEYTRVLENVACNAFYSTDERILGTDDLAPVAKCPDLISVSATTVSNNLRSAYQREFAYEITNLANATGYLVCPITCIAPPSSPPLPPLPPTLPPYPPGMAPLPPPPPAPEPEACVRWYSASYQDQCCVIIQTTLDGFPPSQRYFVYFFYSDFGTEVDTSMLGRELCPGTCGIYCD